MMRISPETVSSANAQMRADEDIQRRMTFSGATASKKDRPTAERVFSDAVTGVAIIENMDDMDEDVRPTFDLNLLDACLIPVEPVEASVDLLSPLRINGAKPTFESRARDSVPRDAKHQKLSSKQKEKLTAKRLDEMHAEGYIVFDDAFLARYPDSRIARVSRQYAAAHPLVDPPARVTKSGTAKRCKRAAYFVRVAEKEQRPCFRRCPSELFYGRSQYMDPVLEGIALTSSFYLKPATNESVSSIPKVKSKSSMFKRILKNFSTNSLEREESHDSEGCSSADDSEGSVHREVTIPPRVASVSIQA